ncbi:hypothetical protein EGW08_021630, partial [Elysia chlorotica]
CLTTFDVVSLGVGSSCGCGMYLTTGIVASRLAGPAGVFSFLLAGFASMLTGGCFHFAKLSSIFPNTSGSAYMYTRATVGEFLAFIIGWGLVGEVWGISRGILCMGVICVCTISWGLVGEVWGISRGILFDPVAGIIVLGLTAVLASGVELSAKVNNLLNLVNLVVLATFISASLALGDFSNLTRGRRVRGFFPFGTAGVVPVAYFAFVGFDGLAATGAECKTPARSIPAGILGSIAINTVAYISVVLMLTMDV